MTWLTLKGGRSASDTFPDAFSFTAQTGAALSSAITSNTITPVGYDMTASISVTGGTMSINGGAFIAGPSTISPGQTLALRLTSSASYSTLATATATIGGSISGSFSATTLADPATPLVGPHASWTTAAGTGAAAPANGTRVTAQAIGAFMIPSFQRAAAGDQFSVRVKAGAWGGVNATAGIAGVRFSGDCVTTTVATPKVVFVPHRLGGTRPEVVYEIKLNADAFLAVAGSNRTANIYAEVLAVDGAVVKRTLSLVVYFETARYDWIGEFSLDGRAGSYVGLFAGMEAMRTALAGSAKSAILTCTQTGFYTATDSAAAFSTPARGYATVTQAAGVTCTIRRTAVPNLNDQNTWGYLSGINGVQWQDITIDNAYLSVFKTNNSANRPDWYDGVKFTDSLGRDRHWNGQNHPGRGPEGLQTQGLASYFTDCYCEEGASPFQWQLLCIGTRTKRTFGDIYSGALVVHGTFDVDNNAGWMRTARNTMTIQYAGAGSGTIQKNEPQTQNGSFGPAHVMKLVDAAGTLVIEFTKYQADANTSLNKAWSWANVATIINARAGWTATVTDVTGFQARFCYASVAGASANDWPPTDAKTTPFTMQSFWDVHGDWYQSGPVQNIILGNCVAQGVATDFSGGLFFGTQEDMLVENIIMNGSHANGLKGRAVFQHMLVENCDLPFSGLVMEAGFTDPHSYIRRCVLPVVSIEGSPWPNQPYIQDNYATTGTFGTGTNTSGNFTGGTFAGQFVNLATYDYRKAGVVAGTVKAYTAPSWDIFGNARAANDADGAVSLNHAAGPAWPYA